MIIAILSGKGGTGKTLYPSTLWQPQKTLSTLTATWKEPNGRLFLKPQQLVSAPVTALLQPSIGINAMVAANVEFCRFNARICQGQTDGTAEIVIPVADALWYVRAGNQRNTP